MINVGTIGHIDHGRALAGLSASQILKREEHIVMHTPFVSGERKVGRNEPCPCRSGKKFKKCHG